MGILKSITLIQCAVIMAMVAGCVPGDESIMRPKAHGTSETPVQLNLRWDVDNDQANQICNHNRHFAEFSGYWKTTPLYAEVTSSDEPITYFDSNTGKPLFIAPQGRSMAEFVAESSKHGWPSFRDEEVVWENVRCLPGGETVSVDGTHLGDNIPDASGSRYCIDLLCISGNPTGDEETVMKAESNDTENSNGVLAKRVAADYSTGTSRGIMAGIVICSIVGLVVVVTQGKKYFEKPNNDGPNFLAVENELS